MRILYLLAMLLIGCGAANAQTDDVYKPRMTKSEAVAYLKANHLALDPSNLGTLVFNGEVEGVEALVVAGVDLKTTSEMMPKSPLELAVLNCGHGAHATTADTLRMIDLFLGAGVDPNHEGMAGLTALIMAGRDGCPPVVIKRLLAGGAKLEKRTPQGYTALSLALLLAKLDTAEALIEAGARLSPEATKKLLDGTHDDNPRLIELVKRAAAGK